MRKNGKALIVLAILQTMPITWADNAAPQNITVPAVPIPSVRPVQKVTALNVHLLDEIGKPIVAEPTFRNEMTNEKATAAPLNIGTPIGLTLTFGSPHPGLEYKFSDSGAVHFHVGRHGAAAAAAWSF